MLGGMRLSGLYTWERISGEGNENGRVEKYVLLPVAGVLALGA